MKKTLKAWAGIIGASKRTERIDKTKELYDEKEILAIYPKKYLANYEKVVKCTITFEV